MNAFWITFFMIYTWLLFRNVYSCLTTLVPSRMTRVPASPLGLRDSGEPPIKWPLWKWAQDVSRQFWQEQWMERGAFQWAWRCVLYRTVQPAIPLINSAKSTLSIFAVMKQFRIDLNLLFCSSTGREGFTEESWTRVPRATLSSRSPLAPSRASTPIGGDSLETFEPRTLSALQESSTVRKRWVKTLLYRTP